MYAYIRCANRGEEWSEHARAREERERETGKTRPIMELIMILYGKQKTVTFVSITSTDIIQIYSAAVIIILYVYIAIALTLIVLAVCLCRFVCCLFFSFVLSVAYPFQYCSFGCRYFFSNFFIFTISVALSALCLCASPTFLQQQKRNHTPTQTTTRIKFFSYINVFSVSYNSFQQQRMFHFQCD